MSSVVTAAVMPATVAIGKAVPILTSLLYHCHSVPVMLAVLVA